MDSRSKKFDCVEEIKKFEFFYYLREASSYLGFENVGVWIFTIFRKKGGWWGFCYFLFKNMCEKLIFYFAGMKNGGVL